MAFRASNAVPGPAYQEAKAVALRVKQQAQMFSVKFQSVTRRDEVIQCWQESSAMSAALKSFRSVPGIGAYAAEQEDDPAYDVAAEFNALIAAVDAVVAEIATVFPKDAGGFLAVVKFGAGTLEMGTFAASALTNLRSLLDAVAASVV